MKSSFRIVVCTAFFLAVSGLSAQNVNRAELEQNQASVNFINYEGPHAQVDTVEQIRTIGYDLGLAVRNGADRAGGDNRYFVIHCVSGPEGEKYDADVFGLGIDVGVDHIRNLRLIIQGYLEGAYEYSAADAALLSRYITIYNAVFRGDWDFFTGRYKNMVMENLIRERAGLSIRYDEWPGQTLMTIPLGTGIPGSLSAIDTSGLTDPGVIESMREDEGRGIEDRQEMVELKEREADEANQSATLQREAIDEEERNITRDQAANTGSRQRIEEEQRQTQQRREEAQQQQQQARQQQQQARQDEAAGRISPEEAARQQEAARQREETAQRQEEEAQQRQQDLEKDQQAVDRQDEAIAERQQQQEQRRQDAETAEQRAEQKAQEAQEERQRIAQDQQEMINSGSAAGTGGGGAASAADPVQAGTAQTEAAQPKSLLAASIVQAKTSLGSLLRLDPSSGATLLASKMNTINARTVTFSGNRLFAVAGTNQKNAVIRLVEINPDTLETVNQGDEDISPNSLLWTGGDSLYAIVVVNKKNYLARFDPAGLARRAQSAVEVHPYASCLVQDGKVLTQGTKGNPLILDAQSLE